MEVCNERKAELYRYKMQMDVAELLIGKGAMSCRLILEQNLDKQGRSAQYKAHVVSRDAFKRTLWISMSLSRLLYQARF